MWQLKCFVLVLLGFLGFVVVFIVLYRKLKSFWFCIKYFSFYCLMMFFVMYCIFVGVFYLFDVENFYCCVGFVYRFLVRLFRICFEVEGMEIFNIFKGKNFIIVVNYQSLLDMFVLLEVILLRMVFVVKKELLFVFIFGLVVWFFGVVFINRRYFKSVRNVMDKIVKWICD